MVGGAEDTNLKCQSCGKTSKVSFSESLRLGWPKCCGAGMRLTKTEADIDAAVSAAIGQDVRPLVSLDWIRWRLAFEMAAALEKAFNRAGSHIANGATIDTPLYILAQAAAYYGAIRDMRSADGIGSGHGPCEMEVRHDKAFRVAMYQEVRMAFFDDEFAAVLALKKEAYERLGWR